MLAGELVKKYAIAFIDLLILVNHTFGQGLFERLPGKDSQICVFVLGYQGNMEITGFGTGAIYNIPTTTNVESGPKIFSIVTAKHVLVNKATGALFDGLLVKLNMPETSPARYLKIPLIHDTVTNYWTSPSGLDLAVIPLPPNMTDGANLASFREYQILTPEKAREMEIENGLIVKSICIQPELLDATDFLGPEVLPTIRIGHLSRLGFNRLSQGNPTIRSHVIDLHSSPGNSGATVLLIVPKKDSSATESLFLGIVQGFMEEQNSYIDYQAPLTNIPSNISSMQLIGADNTTNTVAITKKTIANPNLTLVTPVHELKNLTASPSFIAAASCVVQNKDKYQILTSSPNPNHP